jgi:hypothetical protein
LSLTAYPSEKMTGLSLQCGNRSVTFSARNVSPDSAASAYCAVRV